MVLALGREVLPVIWSVIGIVAFFAVLFLASCWWLDHWIDDSDGNDDKRGGWY